MKSPRIAYVIRGKELDDYSDDPTAHLYWSNEMGWVDKASADRFSEAQSRTLNLPMGGTWELDIVSGRRKKR